MVNVHAFLFPMRITAPSGFLPKFTTVLTALFIFSSWGVTVVRAASIPSNVTIDFTGDGFVEAADHGSNVYTKGDVKITYSASNWYQDTDDGQGSSPALFAGAFSGIETVTVETTSGNEFDFVSFFINAFGGGFASVEGFKNGVSTGVQSSGSGFGQANGSFSVTLNNSIFDDVDRVVITSNAGGFFDIFDSFVLNTVPSIAPSLSATGANPTFTEGGSAVDLYSSVTAATNDSGQTFSGMTMTVTNVSNGASEVLNIASTNVSLNNGNSGSLAGGIGSYSVSVAAGTATVTLSGMTRDNTQMGTLVDGMTYSNSSDNPGSSNRVITITGITDSGSSNNTAAPNRVSTVFVTPVNDNPSLSGLPASLSFTEDISGTLALNLDVNDFVDPDSVNITVTFAASAGTLGLANPGGLLTQASGNGTGTVTLGGTLGNVNTYLNTPSNVTYHPTNVSGTFSLTVTANDGNGSGNVAIGTVTLNVTGVNDEPAITAPGSISVTEDVASALTGISFSDIDAGSSSVTATLSVGSGSLAATSGGGVTAGGSGTGSLTLTGSVANLNTFIAGSNVTFTTASNATSNVTLTVGINDDGNTGSGGAQTASTTVTLSVTAVNDAPSITAPGSISVTEDVATALTGISFSDPDSASSSVTATLSVPSGTLAATSGGGVTAGGSGTGSLTLTGSVANINTFIAGSNVTFTTASNATSNVTLTVDINDGGNTGSGGAQTASATVTLSVTAVNDTPTVLALSPLTVNQSAGTNATIGTFTTTDVDDSTFTYTLVAGSGSTDNSSFNISGSTLRANNATALSGGVYSVRVRTTDSGNANFETSFSITVVDDVAPSAPAGFAATPSGSTVALSWTNPSSDFDSVTIRRSSTSFPTSAADGTAVTSGSTSTSLNQTGLADGTYYYAIFARDAAGNFSTAATASATVDTTPPSAPTGFTATPSGNTIALSWTNPASDFDSVTIRRSTSGFPTSTSDGTAVTSGNTGTSLNQTGLADGTYYYALFARDTAGNFSNATTASATVDTIAPGAPTITAITNDTGASATDQITSDTTLVLSGTAEANATVTILRNSTQIGTTTANGSGAWSFDYTGTTLADGTHTFTATATDAGGNTSAASSAFFVEIDIATPSAPVITAISNDTGASATDGVTSDNTLLISGTAEANTTVTLSRSGVGVIGTTTANGSGAWSFDYTGTTLADGSYLFTAFATDTAGNAGTVSADFPVTIDTTAPVITTQPTGGTYVSGDSFVLTVAATDSSTLAYRWYLGGNLLADYSNRTGSTTASVTHTGIGVFGFAGNYTVQLTDLAGNTTTSNPATVVVNKADQTVTFPVIADKLTTSSPFTINATASTSFTVTYSVVSGPATISGNTVTITGPGIVTIRASQVGDLNYNAAFTERSFTVTKATASVVLGALSQTYNGSARTATATTTPAGLTVSFTYDGSSSAPTDAGSYAVVATVSDAIYQGTASGTLVIAKANQTITFPTPSPVTVGTPVSLNATASSGLAVAYSVVSGNVTLSGSSFTANDANPIQLRATQAGNANFNAATQDLAITNITKLPQTITFGALSNRLTSDTTVALSATSSSGLAVTYAVQSGPATISGSTLTLSGLPGVVTVIAGQSGNAVYSAAGDVSRSFTVNTNYAAPAPDGYASAVTGGGGIGSIPVTVSNAADFRTQAESSNAAVITVVGVLNLGSAPVAVRSHKTIQGADTNATLVGNLSLGAGVTNVIIRGLNLTNPGTTIVSGAYTDGGDAITLTGATHVFITHCSFFDTADHALKITNGADNITVSWCEFYYTSAQTAHRYSVLIGNASGETTPLRLTLHHNLWGAGVDQRAPLSTFGYVHLYNNYFNVTGNSEASVASDQAQFLSERNVYQGVAAPLQRRQVNTSLAIGRILALGNSYNVTTGTAPYAGTDTVFTPSYSYEALPVSDVAAEVTALAGNIAGANVTDPVAGSATIAGPSDTIAQNASFTLTASPSGVTPSSYQWRRNNVDITGATSATFTVASAQPADAATYTVALGLSTGDVVVSRPLTVAVTSAPPLATVFANSDREAAGGGAASHGFMGFLALLALARWIQKRNARAAP
jgi:VCBS repeat-containing protein